jgi:hypothetical protein
MEVEATVRGGMHTEIDNDKMPMMDLQKDSKEVTKNLDNTAMKPISTKESEVMGCWIPDYTPEVVQYVEAQRSATETVMNQTENIGKGKKSTPCKKIKKAQEKLLEEEDLDNMSKGDNEQAEFNQTDMDEWEHAPSNKKKTRMKTQWVATRQSSRLKCHGGTPIEELTSKRKQKQNLDIPSNKPKNIFGILNDFSDEVLIQNANELDILLASDDEGCRD